MKLFRVWKACGAVVIASLAFCATAYIDDAVAVIGEGDDSGGVTTNCGFLNAYQGLCNDNEDGSVKNGGASWHIYSTSDYSGPVYDEVNGILSGGVTVDKIKQDCPASKYGWYLAYGWDGRNDGSGYRHLGPAKHGDGIISNALYNSYRGALNFEQTKLWIQGTLGGTPVDRTIGYGRQLNEGVAEKLYELERNTNVIPDGVGYFCFSGAAFQEFEGRTRAFEGSNQWADTADDRKVATKWINKGKDAVSLTIIGCDSANGCNIRFRHDLKRKYGEDATKYKIKRTSNSSAISSGWIVSETSEKFENVSNGTMKIVEENRVNMRPGQIVCETMDFLVEGKSKWASTTACVKVVGDAQPDGSSALLDIKVKSDRDKYNNYADGIYAEPEDNLTYKATYNPLLQYVVDLVPEAIKIDSGAKIINSSRLTLRQLFNNKNGSMSDWKNAFSVESDGFLEGKKFNKNYSYSVGDTTKREELNSYVVSKNDVGAELKEIAKTNTNSDTKTTPSQVSFAMENGALVSKVITSELKDEAWAVIPYNFKNSTEIIGLKNGGIVYAGESKNVDYNVTVGKRRNGLFEDEYATIVRNAEWRLEVCYYDRAVCYKTDPKTGNLNDENYNKDGASMPEKVSINIPDVPAGIKVWVRSAVYPKDSGTDKNIRADYYDKNNPNSWAYSEWVELTVAKKPSFQVWGGSIYSAGEIDIPIANKTNLAGYGEVAYTFGSWTELGLVADGLVKGLASGAGLGYARNDGGELWPNYAFMSNGATTNYVGDGNNNYVSDTNLPGGSEGEDFCRMSTLSFANVDCVNGGVGNLNKESLGSSANSNKSALIAKFNDTESAEYTLEQHNEILDSYNIGAMEIAKGETKIITVQNGTAKINGNIKYANDSYTTMAEIPKLIIYAKNIEIDCAVERIDAVLIADGSVDTCNSGDVNLQQNSTQLKINGSVVSDTIDLNRTYGAATGANSIIPAEIVNYDTSLYLWANQRSDITKTGKIMTAYQHELSPRY